MCLSSGGVLLDSQGRVIGINTAIADPTCKGSSSGVGFAIPMDTVSGLVQQILQYGRVLRPALGVTLAPPQLLRQLGEEGVLLLEVSAVCVRGVDACGGAAGGERRVWRGAGACGGVWCWGRCLCCSICSAMQSLCIQITGTVMSK